MSRFGKTDPTPKVYLTPKGELEIWHKQEDALGVWYYVELDERVADTYEKTKIKKDRELLGDL